MKVSRQAKSSFSSWTGLRCGASMLAVCALTSGMPAFAQQTADPAGDAAATADAPVEDEILVTGLRQQLQNAQGIKKNSDSIVDSVTAEDIGALPDRSVTETLQRIPGVSITRFAASVDPDHFSVEGSGVVVRGLTYVRSEFNGRDAFTANNGRGLGFADVPSELLFGVDVFKSPTAERVEGGIAGIVNLRTRKPFDSKDSYLAGSVEMNYGDFVKKSAPTFSIVGSKRWETGIGEIGILGSYVNSEIFYRNDRLQISSFRSRQAYSDGTRTDVRPFAGATATEQVIVPRGISQASQETNRKRYGYSAALQWRSNDSSMEATFEFLRSDSRQAWTEHVVGIATDQVRDSGDTRAVNGTSLEFDDSGLLDRGILTGPTGWRSDRPNNGTLRTPVFGLQSSNIRRDVESKFVTDDFSGNFKWDVTDRLKLSLDFQHVKSTSDVLDNGVWISSYQDALIDLNGDDYPTVAFLPPQNCVSTCVGTPGSNGGTDFFNDDDDYPSYFTGTHQSYIDPYNSFYRANMDHAEQSEGKSDAAKIDLQYDFPEESFIKNVKAGARYADRDQTARFSTYNWGNLSEQWGGGGPVWLDEPVDGNPNTNGGTVPNTYDTFFFDNYFRGQSSSPAGNGRLFYNSNTATNYQEYINFGNLIAQEWGGTSVGSDGVTRNNGWNSLANRFGVVPGTLFLPGEINSANEKNKAAYIQASFGKDFDSGSSFTGNIGIRYSNTKRTSFGNIAFPRLSNALPSDTECTNPGNTSVFCLFTPAQRADARAFNDGTVIASVAKLKYDYFLPTVNLKYAVNDQVQFRASYFKGITPPEFGLTRNYFNVNRLEAVIDIDSAGIRIPGTERINSKIDAGNPFLKPIESDNFDVTAEWYFSKVGQLTASVFYKRLTNVLTNDTTRTDFTNNGVTYSGVVSIPVNSDKVGKIKGFEIAYQQTYDFLPGFLGGLGLQANYTYVSSKGVPQSTLSGTDPDVGAGRQSTLSGDNFPLQGLSKHTVNITPFYDRGPLSIRASYSWRSQFLVTLRDVVDPFDPIFQRPYGQLDGSITVSVGSNLKLGLQGVNLLNSVTKTAAAIEDRTQLTAAQLADPTVKGPARLITSAWNMNDRRFTLFARFNF